MSESIPKPDESNYNNMQVIAAASGPEAEARRQEMAQWSEHAGQLADSAARLNSRSAETSVSRGDPAEVVAQKLSGLSADIAANGVRTEISTVVKSVEQGVQVSNSDAKATYRSPAHITERIQ